MRNDQLGIRRGEWPTTAYMKVDFDFTAGEHIKIVDDPNENVIKIYGGAEGKELAYIKIDGRKIDMYKPGADRPSVTDTVKSDITKGGYAHFWNHISSDDATLDNIRITTIREIGNTENNGIKPNTRDLFADTWTATDAEGRTVTTAAGAPNGAKVGIFYFLWHETSNNKLPIYDHTAAYEKGGIDEMWKVMQQGSLGSVHYWGEPYFGYYASDDEWVIRKHGYMLSEMGVDFIFVDSTNGIIYEKSLEALLRVWSKMRSEGQNTPQICFHCGNDDTNAASSLNYLWNNYYSVGKYSDLWFYWDGKPLIFFPDNVGKTISDEMKNFFTARQSWANTNDSWYKSKKGKGRWAWADMYPQKPGLSPSGKIEQMIVMCGFWANGSYGTNAGRS
jgi:hypothetical protein